MSEFIEVHPFGSAAPMLLNLDEVMWIGKSTYGNACIKYKDKERGYQTVTEEYENIKAKLLGLVGTDESDFY